MVANPPETISAPKFKTPHWIVDELIRIATDRGMSLERVAQDAGLGRNALYWWKRRSVKNPTLQSADAVARVLGYEIDLLKLDEEDFTDGAGI